MLEDGFKAETAERTTGRIAHQEGLDMSDMDEFYEEVDGEDDD